MNKKKDMQSMRENGSQKNIKKILYATDLSSESPKVFQYVLSLAKQHNAEVTSLHVIDRYSPDEKLTLATYLSKEQRLSLKQSEASEVINEMSRRCDQSFIEERFGTKDVLSPKELGLPLTNKVVYGNIADQILQQSEKLQSDLIVLGQHDKSLISKLLKNLPKKVSKKAKVPVTVVPTD